MKNNDFPKHIEEKYIRVGTDYYQITTKPNLNDEYERCLLKWKKDTIKDDFGKEFLKSIEKYKGFIMKPSHTNYQQVVGGFFNQYYPLEIKPKQGIFPNTEKFLRQLFKEHYDLFLDYIGIIWHQPSQILPILCIVSEERHTGKTTFLNWLKYIFYKNMGIVSSKDLESDFNSDWIGKLIIAVDEAKFEKRSTMDLIKELSTAKFQNSHKKGIEKYEIPFIGKFVLTSNHVNDFISIDEKEIRYWIREIEPFHEPIPNLSQNLEEEAPAFLYFINNRQIKTKKTTRMWFKKSEIHTSALDNLTGQIQLNLENEIKTCLIETIEDFDLEEIKFTLKDLVALMKDYQFKVNYSQLKNIIEGKWCLKKSNNSTSYKKYIKVYDEYQKKYVIHPQKANGRVFTFQKYFLNQVI